MTDEINIENTTETTQDGAETVVMPSLEEQLRQAELNAQEHHDAWLRAKADAENARRRALDEIDKARRFALDKFAAELLPVKDSLEAALATGDSASIESLKSGVELTLKQLSGVFEKNSIKELSPLGDKFDPNYHQAIAMVDGEGEANTVATVLQKGYALNDRVMRPALVTVLKPK
ncbi:MAG: nucleotide exchange factor GrpE [Hydrogenophilales bacterium 28-61-23]|nr:MAG: nucleotide exchange factor GrpE [Hydrogenophilales bacterium 28-61-23]